MIDNFDQINRLITKDLMSVECDLYDIYYHLQIIKRSKDTGEGANSTLTFTRIILLFYAYQIVYE